MIGIVPADQDIPRFLLFQDPSKLDSPICQFCFTIELCLACPEILGAVILHQLNKYSSERPQLIERIRKGLYVDNLITSTNIVNRSIPEPSRL